VKCSPLLIILKLERRIDDDAIRSKRFWEHNKDIKWNNNTGHKYGSANLSSIGVCFHDNIIVHKWFHVPSEEISTSIILICLGLASMILMMEIFLLPSTKYVIRADPSMV